MLLIVVEPVDSVSAPRLASAWYSVTLVTVGLPLLLPLRITSVMLCVPVGSLLPATVSSRQRDVQLTLVLPSVVKTPLAAPSALLGVATPPVTWLTKCSVAVVTG